MPKLKKKLGKKPFKKLLNKSKRRILKRSTKRSLRELFSFPELDEKTLSSIEYSETNLLLNNIFNMPWNIVPVDKEDFKKEMLKFYLYVTNSLPPELTRDFANKFNNILGINIGESTAGPFTFFKLIRGVNDIFSSLFFSQIEGTQILVKDFLDKFINQKITIIDPGRSAWVRELQEITFNILPFFNKNLLQEIDESTLSKTVTLGKKHDPIYSMKKLQWLKGKLFNIIPKEVFNKAGLENNFLKLNTAETFEWLNKIRSFLDNKDNSYWNDRPVKKVLKDLNLLEAVNLTKIPKTTLGKYQAYLADENIIIDEYQGLLGEVQKILPKSWINLDTTRFKELSLVKKVRVLNSLEKQIRNFGSGYFHQFTYAQVLEKFPEIAINYNQAPMPLLRLFLFREKKLHADRIANQRLLMEIGYEFEVSGIDIDYLQENYQLIPLVPSSDESAVWSLWDRLQDFFPSEWIAPRETIQALIDSGGDAMGSYWIAKVTHALEDFSNILNNEDNKTLQEVLDQFPIFLLNYPEIPMWTRFITLNVAELDTDGWKKIFLAWKGEVNNSNVIDQFFWITSNKPEYECYNSNLFSKWSMFKKFYDEINERAGRKVIKEETALKFWMLNKNIDLSFSPSILDEIRDDSEAKPVLELYNNLTALFNETTSRDIFEGTMIKDLNMFSNWENEQPSAADDTSLFTKWNTFLKYYTNLRFTFGSEFLVLNVDFHKWLDYSLREIDELNGFLANLLDEVQSDDNDYRFHFSKLVDSKYSELLVEDDEKFKSDTSEYAIRRIADFTSDYEKMWEDLIKTYELLFEGINIFNREKVVRYINSLEDNEKYITWRGITEYLYALVDNKDSDFDEFKVKDLLLPVFPTKVFNFEPGVFEHSFSTFLINFKGVFEPIPKEWNWHPFINSSSLPEEPMLGDQPVFNNSTNSKPQSNPSQGFIIKDNEEGNIFAGIVVTGGILFCGWKVWQNSRNIKKTKQKEKAIEEGLDTVIVSRTSNQSKSDVAENIPLCSITSTSSTNRQYKNLVESLKDNKNKCVSQPTSVEKATESLFVDEDRINVECTEEQQQVVKESYESASACSIT